MRVVETKANAKDGKLSSERFSLLLAHMCSHACADLQSSVSHFNNIRKYAAKEIIIQQYCQISHRQVYQSDDVLSDLMVPQVYLMTVRCQVHLMFVHY